MFHKFCFRAFLFLCFCLSLASSSAIAQERIVVGGTFYDCRYGDILLGANNLTLAPKAKITVQNVPLSASKLDKKYAKMVGCAHLNELGLVAELHLDPVTILHKLSCDFVFLEYGPQVECQGGEPVFVRFYMAEELSPCDSLCLYVDGQAITSGQIKHSGFIYYPAALSPGWHSFCFEVRRGNSIVNSLQWETSAVNKSPKDDKQANSAS